jgi:tetratricopeptide (TPR) repeat protein
MGAKIGRNAPCPCGSGKKYKKCCLARDSKPGGREASPALPPTADLWGYSEVDQLSNHANDLIRAGRYDEAAQVCEQLRRDYPDMVDGLHRQAQLDDARGLHEEAARYYRAAADLAERQGDFDRLTLDEWRTRADILAPSP